MFSKQSSEDEIATAMSTELKLNSSQKSRVSFDKLAKAIDYLSTAAEMFDDVGLSSEAEEVTKLLEKIASDTPKKPKSKEVQKRMKNMLETGTPFSKEEYHADDESFEDEIEV